MGKFSVGAGIRGSTSGDSDDNGFYTSTQMGYGGGEGNFGLYGGGQANISWQGQMTGGSVYGGVTYTPVGNKNFNPSFYTYGAGAKGQYEDGSWTWQATVSANFDADRYKKVMAKEEWAKAMTEAGAKPKTFKDYQNAAMAKSLKEAYARQYYEEHWKNQTETERRMDIADRQIQRDYTNRRIVNGDNTKTYIYNPVSGNVYVEVNDQRVISNEGSDQVMHYNYILSKYGDNLDNMLKNTGDYIMLGEQGYGTGLQAGQDVYDDRITVAMKNGNGEITIREMLRSNLEATIHDPNSGATNNYTDIKGGRYSLSTSSWAPPEWQTIPLTFSINNGQDITTFGAVKNPNNGNTPFMNAEYIHMGGSTWNWSHGCMSIYRDDYSQIAGMFGSYDPTKPINSRWTFDYAGLATRNATYYLLR